MQNLLNFIGIRELHQHVRDINSYDVAKFIAIIAMIIDHIGHFFWPENYWLRAIGRAAFPIFFFLIGYSKSYGTSWNLLALGAIITLHKGMMLGAYLPMDVLISIFIVRIVMNQLEKRELLSGANLYVVMAVTLFWHIGMMALTAFGALGLLFAICGYLKRLDNDGIAQSNFIPCLAITLVVNLILQSALWDGTADFEAVKNYFIAIFSAVSVGLWFYIKKFKVSACDKLPAKELVLFVSRNALFVYWLHFMLFVTLSALLIPQLWTS